VNIPDERISADVLSTFCEIGIIKKPAQEADAGFSARKA
jgi:hypothetical protein